MNELSPALVGQELPSIKVSWDKPDVLLYALGVGARPDNGLEYIYEGRGPVVLPTFSVIPGMKVLEGLTSSVKGSPAERCWPPAAMARSSASEAYESDSPIRYGPATP